MSERSRKRPRDLNELARSIVDEATGETPKQDDSDMRNLAAVALGKLGGKKGGPARAAKLSPERRSEIARAASKARWAAERKRKAQN